MSFRIVIGRPAQPCRMLESGIWTIFIVTSWSSQWMVSSMRSIFRVVRGITTSWACAAILKCVVLEALECRLMSGGFSRVHNAEEVPKVESQK